MLKNIIFLDIDGVLNYGPVKGHAEGMTTESMYGFDDKLLMNLKQKMISERRIRTLKTTRSPVTVLPPAVAILEPSVSFESSE